MISIAENVSHRYAAQEIDSIPRERVPPIGPWTFGHAKSRISHAHNPVVSRVCQHAAGRTGYSVWRAGSPHLHRSLSANLPIRGPIPSHCFESSRTGGAAGTSIATREGSLFCRWSDRG